MYLWRDLLGGKAGGSQMLLASGLDAGYDRHVEPHVRPGIFMAQVSSAVGEVYCDPQPSSLRHGGSKWRQAIAGNKEGIAALSTVNTEFELMYIIVTLILNLNINYT